MTGETARELAEGVQTSVGRLLSSFRLAGISISGPDAVVSDQDKQALLAHLRGFPGTLDEESLAMPDQFELIPEDEGNVLDEAEFDDTPVPQRYDITSYGADWDVHGIVRRLRNGDIFIPHFQREYVWNMREASRFIESLLLGLPVPGVILAKEPDSNRLFVIDGQQRLKTLQFFFDGEFNPQPEDKRFRRFLLENVQVPYEGRAADDLSEGDRVHLENTIIHATIVKQNLPSEDDTSIYHIFERLNTGGRRLFSHEIRLAIYYGSLLERIRELNEFAPWRAIFGKKNKRLKDQDLILRFIALRVAPDRYARPMEEFLNKFVKRFRHADEDRLGALSADFKNTISTIYQILGAKAFRPQRAINAAIFDSVMVGTAARLDAGPIKDPDAYSVAYAELLANEDYQAAAFRSTSDTTSVQDRIKCAIDAFAPVQ